MKVLQIGPPNNHQYFISTVMSYGDMFTYKVVFNINNVRTHRHLPSIRPDGDGRMPEKPQRHNMCQMHRNLTSALCRGTHGQRADHQINVVTHQTCFVVLSTNTVRTHRHLPSIRPDGDGRMPEKRGGFPPHSHNV